MKSFSMNERMDNFCPCQLTKLPFPTSDLKNIMQKTLILLHGNACAESGFSINEQMLEGTKSTLQWFIEENMSECQKTVVF